MKRSIPDYSETTTKRKLGYAGLFYWKYIDTDPIGGVMRFDKGSLINYRSP